MSLKQEDIVRVKGRGFLINRGTENFSGRVVTPGGAYTAQQLSAIAECSKLYGSGKVVFTSRLSAEITGIPYENIEKAEAFIEKCGLSFGGTGDKIRPITACKGTTCVYGNIDTQAIAKELHEKFYVGYRGVKLPHKYKICVGGCPNSCMKPSLNDIGFEGRKPAAFDAEKCHKCPKCVIQMRCPSKAVDRSEDGTASIDRSKCLSCGVCVGKCPFGAVPKAAESMVAVYVGGTWGKSQRTGTKLSKLISVSEIPAVTEKVILWYRENGYVKERLGKAIDRIGIESLEKAVFSDDILARKDEILAAPIKERP